jgi:hypothetical protein
MRSLDRKARHFLASALVAGLVTVAFLVWMIAAIGGPRITDAVDVLGELAAALAATAACGVAALHASSRRSRWVLLGASSFAWAAGETVWAYYDLIRGVSVPFPSLADVGFLCAVPLAVAGLLLFPSSPRRAADRIQGVLDGCIIAGSILFASWATVLGPLYKAHEGGVLEQTLSLAYPASDVAMVSLVVILLARAGRRGRASLGLVMAGLVAFAIADSAFAYMTQVNNYSNGTVLDSGWVAGYLLIGLGALRAVYAPTTEAAEPRVTTLSLVAPYVPVLAVLAVTSVELLLGRRLGGVDWIMVFVLAVLVLGRHVLNLWERAALVRLGENGRDWSDEPVPAETPHTEPVLLRR